MTSSPDNGYLLLDYPHIAVDQGTGNVFVTYAAVQRGALAPYATIFVSGSTDGGGTFGNPTAVPSAVGNVGGQRLAYGLDLFLVWANYANNRLNERQLLLEQWRLLDGPYHPHGFKRCAHWAVL